MFNFVRRLLGRLMAALRWVYRQSIWHPLAIPAEEWKYRNSKRIFFPFLDLCLIYAGRSGLHNGIPAIGEYFPEPVLDAFSRILLYGGFIALVGVAFPRLWSVELGAKYAISIALLLYCLCLAFLAGAGDDARGFVTPIAFMALAAIVYRISVLLGEYGVRRAKRKGAAAAAEKAERFTK